MTRDAVWAVIVASAAAAALTPLRAGAQAARAAISLGPLQVEGSIRVRLEAWDWFTPSPLADHDYAFGAGLLRSSVGMVRPNYDWQVELAAPMFAGLPENAVAPAPQASSGSAPPIGWRTATAEWGSCPNRPSFA